MALDTYDGLRAAVAAWLQRDDLSAVIPDCIALCERKVARRLRVDELLAVATTNPLTETVALPADFQELLTYEISFGTTKYAPDFVQPSEMDAISTLTPTVQSIPRYFTIRNANLEHFPAPQSGTTFISTLTYYKKLVALATTSPNWLLTNHPDVYLYGTLAATEAFSRDDPRVPMWKAAFEEGMAEIERMDDRKRIVKGFGVDTGLPGVGGPRTSIDSGFY